MEKDLKFFLNFYFNLIFAKFLSINEYIIFIVWNFEIKILFFFFIIIKTIKNCSQFLFKFNLCYVFELDFLF